MDTINGTLLAILFTIFVYIIYKAWKVNQYWKERGIPFVKPWLFVGNSAPFLFRQKDAGKLHEDLCKQFPNEPFIGFLDFMKPVLIIKDADIIEKILIKDFVHFVDHGLPIDEIRNPMDSNLFSMNGKRWKAFRNKLSPIFTTGKLRLMFETMSECGDSLISLMENSSEDIEMKEVLGRFAMAVIGSCAFGIDTGNLTQADSEFRRMGKSAFQMKFLQFIKLVIVNIFPSLSKIVSAPFNNPDVVKYFSRIIRNTVKYRRENGITRNDFLQLMMQLQDKGYVEVQTKDPDDDYLNIESTHTTEKFELTDDQMTGQAYIFLIAGFEGTTLTMMYTLYELSKNPEIQEKVREEVQREFKKSGSLTYDSIKEMRYLEQCIKESTRKYPPTQVLFRKCTKEYTLPNGTIIEPGQMLIVSLKALHYNTNYYPEPYKYIPERFDPDNTIPACAHLPFGNGPRICIAMRFAMMEIKYCLAKLLLNYRFRVSPKTKEPLTVNVMNLFTSPNEKVLFNVTKVTA